MQRQVAVLVLFAEALRVYLKEGVDDARLDVARESGLLSGRVNDQVAVAVLGAGGHALGVGGEQHLHDLEQVFDPALAGRVRWCVAI